HLHHNLADCEIVGDLLIHQPAGHGFKNLRFPWCEGREPRKNCPARRHGRKPLRVFLKCVIHCVENFAAIKWLEEEVNCASLHSPNAFLNIVVLADENHWQIDVPLAEPIMEVEATPGRKAASKDD